MSKKTKKLQKDIRQDWIDIGKLTATFLLFAALTTGATKLTHDKILESISITDSCHDILNVYSETNPEYIAYKDETIENLYQDLRNEEISSFEFKAEYDNLYDNHTISKHMSENDPELYQQYQQLDKSANNPLFTSALTGAAALLLGLTTAAAGYVDILGMAVLRDDYKKLKETKKPQKVIAAQTTQERNKMAIPTQFQPTNMDEKQQMMDEIEEIEANNIEAQL